MAEKVQVDVALTGADKAVSGLEDVADVAEDVERLEPEVAVESDTSGALHGLADVSDEARQLADTKIDVPVTVDNNASGPLADVFADLDKLQARAKEADDKLSNVGREAGGPTGGPRIAGNAIADLTGPLGDASGAASDFGGVFDGLSDIAEKTALKMGATEEAAAGLSSVLGGAGFVVAGAMAAWTYFNQKQDEAREKLKKTAEEQRKLSDLISQAKYDEAAQQLVDTYGDVYDAAHKAGIGVQEVTNFLAGYTDDLPTATAKIQELSRTQAEHGDTTATLIARYSALIEPVLSARNQIDKANDSIRSEDDRVRAATDALGKNATATAKAADQADQLKAKTEMLGDAFDELRGKVNLDAEMHQFETAIGTAITNAQTGVVNTGDDIDGLKRQIIDLAQAAHANPIDVASTLDKIDRGDLAGVKADAERYYNASPVQVAAQLKLTITQGVAAAAAGAIRAAVPGATVGAAPVTNVTVNVPRGYQGDVLGVAARFARRSGGLYHRARR